MAEAKISLKTDYQDLFYGNILTVKSIKLRGNRIMRYIGNKTRIIDQIDALVEEKHLSGGIFADLFTGTGSVADHFKDRFTIVANDIMHYASIFAEAKLLYSDIPTFKQFVKRFATDPFTYWNQYDYSNERAGFVTNNFSEAGGRRFFQEKNSYKIDTIRAQLDTLLADGTLSHNEWVFLLASLLENVMGVSNTSGTYEAFFKYWESRSNKTMEFSPLTFEHLTLASKNNTIYTEDANSLVRKISGSVAYIDTPYTITQYASAYHVLETIALNDNPDVKGKTGRRVDRKMSAYSRKKEVGAVFEDLLRQLDFTHVIISYSNQSLLPIEDLLSLVKRFAVDGKYELHSIAFQEYSNLNSSQKGNGHKLKEYLIYFKKDLQVIKSPLNYAGSKDRIIGRITENLPQHFSDFVDAMGGAFNVGANVVGTGKTFYNEKDPVIYKIEKQLLDESHVDTIRKVKSIIHEYHLKKEDKESFNRLRSDYNSSEKPDPLILFVLTLYSFQHMNRFNSHGDYNVPVGNSGLTEDVIKRMENYRSKMPIGKMTCKSFEQISIEQFDKDSLFYFDPPYIITAAAYNDGKRLNAEWSEQDELNLLTFLEHIDKSGRKFLLSNVIEHHGQKNTLLTDWVSSHGYNLINIGTSGRRYQRKEVLIRNY